MLNNPDLQNLIEALKHRHQPQNDGAVSPKMMQGLVMAVLAAVGALVWNSVTTKTPETFGLIQQQTAEIRTTVLEMRSTLNGINERLENTTRQTNEQQARITGLESTMKSTNERLQRLEEGTRRDH